MINRDDMLKLTRRMNPSRNCFARIEGAYMDSERFDNGTFNIHFGKQRLCGRYWAVKKESTKALVKTKCKKELLLILFFVDILYYTLYNIKNKIIL